MSDRELIESLRRQLSSTVLPLLRGARRAALIDFPVHSNVGDSMIWLGERLLLRAHGIALIYAASPEDYNESVLRRSLGKGDPILIQGGGNLGDIWPREEALRERVIEAFHDHPIIQLPQSIWFEHAANRARARAVFHGHPDFTLLVRDEISRGAAEEQLGLEARLCPDVALHIPDLPRPAPHLDGVVWLGRKDEEGRYAANAGAERARIHYYDWVEDAQMPSRRTLWRLRSLEARLHCDGRFGLVRRFLYERIAQQRLRRAVEMVARGRSLVTERLHGHILALLLGMPHVLLDNSYGKLGAFHRTWTKDCKLARFAESPEDAMTRALELAETNAD